MYNEEKKTSLRISSFSFFARFGILCLPQGRVPFLIGVIAFTLFKLQTLSISLLFTTNYLEDQSFSVVFVAQKVSSAFIFGELFSFSESPLILYLVFAIIQIYTFSLLLLIIFLLVQTYRLKRIASWAQSIWAYTVYLHMWALGTPMINFCFALIKHVIQGTVTDSIPSSSQSIMAGLAGVSNFINLAILTMAIYFTSIPLKFKDPLSMKSKFHMGMELSENLLLYVIYLFLPDSASKIWIILSLNGIYTFLRVYKIYETLPYFKVAWLKIEVIITSIISTLTLLNLIGWIMKGNYMHIPQRFIIVFWLMLTPVVGKSSVMLLDRILLTILSGSMSHSPTRLMHIIYVVKYFLRRRVKTAANFKSQNPHEILLLGKASITKIYNEDKEEGSELVKFDWEIMDHIKTFIDNHFSKISEKFPKSIPLKIMKIWSRFKYQKSYLEVANLIQQMKMDPLISVNTEISLLNIRFKLEEEMKTRADQISIQNRIDMKKFIIMQDDTERIQALMIKQAELQKKFWIVYTTPKLEFQVLYQISEKIRRMKTEIEMHWKRLESFNNKKYIIPYLLYGMYLENLNNNPSLSDTFIKQNVWALIKMNNHLLTNVLNEDTLYQSESTQLTVSANKDTLGIVTAVSNSFFTHFGYEKKNIMGINIEVLMTSYYKENHRFYMLRYFNTGTASILDKSRKAFIKTNHGTIKPILLYVKQNPFIENGLNFIAIMRPIQESGDFMLIRSNGDIDGATDRIRYILGIERDITMSIFDFSKHTRPLVAIFNRKIFDHVKRTFVNRSYSIEQANKMQPMPQSPPAEFVSENRELLESPHGKEEIKSDSQRGKLFVKSIVDNTPNDISSTRRILFDQSGRSTTNIVGKNSKRSGITTEYEMHSMRRKEHHTTFYTDQFTQKIDDKDQDHIHKIFSEMGADFTFYANDENKSRVNCILRVETDIHDDTWILIFRIDSIQASHNPINDEMHNTSYDPRDEKSVIFSHRTHDINALGILEGLNSITSQGQEPLPMPSNIGQRATMSQFYGAGETMSESNKKPLQFTKAKTLFEGNRFGHQRTKSSSLKQENVETWGNFFPTVEEKNDARKAKIYAFMPDYAEDESLSQTIEQHSSDEEGEEQKRAEKQRDMRKQESKYYAVDVDPNYEPSELHEPSSSKKQKNIQTKDLMHKFKANYETSSIASSRTTKNRTDKIIEECVDQVYIHTIFNNFTMFFLITILILESLIISQASFASSSYTQIKNKGDIVITAYIRADNMDLTNFAARLMNVAIHNQFGDQSQEIYPETIVLLKNFADAMLQKNIELEKAIGGIEIELQHEFFSNGVTMYDFNETGLAGTKQEMNTFRAIDKLYSTVLKILSNTTVEFPSKNYRLDYMIYNSLDSLALECERAVELTSSLMSKTISNFLSQMQLLTGASLAIVLLCIVATLGIIAKMNRNANKFWTYFMSISDDDVEANLKFINKFLSAIAKDFQSSDGTENHLSKRAKIVKSEKSMKNFSLQHDSKQASFTWYYASNTWLVLKLWPVLILLGATTIINFMNSSLGVNKMKQMQAQIINVVYYMYITDIGFISLIDIVLHNGTTKTRGQPVLKEVKRITSYGGNNQEYVIPFRNEDGSYASYQYNLIFGTPCNDTSILPDQSYFDLCNQLSGGTGMMGLLGTNPIYEKTMQEFADAWMQSPMSPSLIPEFMIRYYRYVFFVNNFQNYYIMALQRVTNEAFFNYIATEKANFVELVAICSVIAAIMTMVSYKMLLTRIREKDYRLKCFIKLVNVKVVLKNRWLKNYLIENTDKLGDNLKKL